MTTTDACPGLDAEARIARVPGVVDGDIRVAVHGRVVTLDGHCRAAAAHAAAANAVSALVGVRAVVDGVHDAEPSSAAAPDGDEDVCIAEAVLRTLDWDLWVPAGDVKVIVRQGWVTLQGVVDSRYQRDAALRDAARVPGVRGVTDAVALRATPGPAEVRARIAAALRRSAERDAREIRIETFPGTVVLRGSVPSRAARREVEQAAWTAPGVGRVRSHLEVRDPEAGDG